MQLILCRLQQLSVNGEILLDLEEGDLDLDDFPNAQKFHWRQFWRKLSHIKNQSFVNSQPMELEPKTVKTKPAPNPQSMELERKEADWQPGPANEKCVSG